jgi:hypothetical protein
MQIPAVNQNSIKLILKMSLVALYSGACIHIFRKKFEQIPTNKLWRGDALHHCESEKYYEYDYYLQSYSNKDMASFFGDILINSKSIKDYGGSFSTTLFNKFVSKTDELYLNAFIFYINYPQYSKLFDFNLFYKLYIIISGYGALGKKYKNAVVKIFRNMNLEFYYHKSHIDEIIIADDENEIMFFDVIYKCNNI